MLDDETLAALVRDTLDGVEVPAGGPSRVLAARDRLDPGSATSALASERDSTLASDRGGVVAADGVDGVDPGEGTASAPRRWNISSRLAVGSVAALVAVIVAVVAVTGIRGGASSTTVAAHSLGQPVQSRMKPQNQPVAGGGGTTSAGPSAASSSASAGPDNQSSGAASPASGTSNVATGPSADKVVQTGSLTLTVPAAQLNATVAQLTDRATGAGGEVAKSQAVETISDPYADVTLQVPAGDFASLLAGIRGLGRVGVVNTSATDVTSNYVDLQAQITALQAAEQQFLTILAKAQTISDILAVQAQITPLQTQIQQLQGQLQVLDQQTSTATLAVHIAVPGPRAPSPSHPSKASGLSSAWDHAWHSFTNGVDSVVAALGGIAVFLLCVIALALVGRLGWVMVRRRLV